MKKDIHPKLYPAIFVDLTTGAEFISFTTRKTQETKKIGDVEYNIVKVEITSDSHPFFTGKQVILDTAGRVDKFRAKMQKMKEMKGSKTKTPKESVQEAAAEEIAEEIIESTEVPMEEITETMTVVEEKVEKKPTAKKAGTAKKTPAKKPAAKKTAAKKK